MGDTEVGTFNAVGSDSTQTGSNALSNGTIYVGKKLNGTDGNAVDLTDIALNVSANASVGPLTSTGGEIELASAGFTTSGTGTILTVNGGATFDSNSFTGIQIEGPGTTAGTDYSQMSASGTVSLNGGLALFDFGTSSCPSLHMGDVDTLITATGALSGTFTGVPDGTVLAPCGMSGPTLRINYTAHSVTATVVTTGASSSSLALMASTANPVTNQPVTLTATITAASGSPSGGTVEFDDNEGPIARCGTQPVSWNGTTGTSTCQTSFAAASSPEFALATFTPTNASVQGSGNGPVQVSIGQDSTGTAVAASNASPTAGQSVTYTATVTPADSGPTEPSGTVQYLDGTAPIAGCGSQPLTAGAASSTATCTVNYGAAGAHSITATYSGDTNFTGSASPAQAVNVQPSPPVKPSNTAPPVASGARTVGQTDTATTGTWSGSGPIIYSYQWRRCNPGCIDIAGATGSSYTPAATDVGADILALVTATNSAGSAQASSNTVGPVAPRVPQILAALASVLSPHGKAATIGALLKTGGFTFAFTAPSAGTLAITWYFLPKAAHLTKATKTKPMTVASAWVSFAMAGTTKVKVRLTRKGKLLLMAARRLQLVSHVGYTPTAGNPTVKTNRFTLRR